MMRKITLFIFCIFSISNFAQQDAWVYFVDKENVTESLANPISILTQRAIDRKAAHGVLIDARDVPVTESYISEIKNQEGITVLAKSKWMNCVHVRGEFEAISELLSLEIVDEIVYADGSLNARPGEISNKFETEEVMVDFVYGNSGNQIEMFNGDVLHEMDFTGAGMVIAVIDAGFPNVDIMDGFDRLRTNNGILGGYDFYDRNEDVYANTSSSHGTLVLSDMAGYVEDQFVGTAPDAEYYLFRTENAPNENPVEESLWVEALERADSLGVDLVNSSLGYKDYYDNAAYNYSSEEMDGETAFITQGANIGYEKGLLIVNSAGNAGENGVNAPADSEFVFSIGAVNSSGVYALFSSQGSDFQPVIKPDVAAQGQSSTVINSNDQIVTASGTSFSSPILAGGIACLWQALPDLDNGEIMQLVRESASQFDSPDYFLGYGIPDLSLALNLALSTDNNTIKLPEVKVYPNPVKANLNIYLPDEWTSATIKLYNVLGKMVMQQKLTNTNNSINVKHLDRGIYLLQLESGNYHKTIKLVKD